MCHAEREEEDGGTDEKKARHASHATVGGTQRDLDLVGEACEGEATFISSLSHRSRRPYGPFAEELAHQEGLGQSTITKPERPVKRALPLCLVSPPLLRTLARFSRHGKYNSGERKVRGTPGACGEGKKNMDRADTDEARRPCADQC
jgi:hypothetical protein